MGNDGRRADLASSGSDEWAARGREGRLWWRREGRGGGGGDLEGEEESSLSLSASGTAGGWVRHSGWVWDSGWVGGWMDGWMDGSVPCHRSMEHMFPPMMIKLMQLYFFVFFLLHIFSPM